MSTDDIKSMISEKDLVPDGVKIEYSGQNEEIMDAMQQMLLMLVVGFILVYLIMVAQFQSSAIAVHRHIHHPAGIHRRNAGAADLQVKDVSVVSMMGFVMLMGIVVNNAIVLVDCINRFRLEGMDDG